MVPREGEVSPREVSSGTLRYSRVNSLQTKGSDEKENKSDTYLFGCCRHGQPIHQDRTSDKSRTSERKIRRMRPPGMAQGSNDPKA